MKTLHHLIDYLALLFGVRTENNTEGYSRKTSWWRTILLPFLQLVLLVWAIGLVLLMVFGFLAEPYFKERNTTRGLEELGALVIKKQRTNQVLPITLEEVIANDPLIRDLTVDSWGNSVRYQPNIVTRSFTLTSAGKDEEVGTADDLKVTGQVAPLLR